MPSLVTLNRDLDRYSDPDMFDPARYANDQNDAYASALSSDFMRRDHFHYGFGRRLCQGIHLAEDSLFMAISRILWAFDLEELDSIPLDMADKICTCSLHSFMDLNHFAETQAVQILLQFAQSHSVCLSHAGTRLRKDS